MIFPGPASQHADTGPNNNPEFHVKARATRIGSKFEWPDVSTNVTITGQIEADYEGNFSRADNRNVSSIRSNALQLRLAYGRIDWNVRPNTDLFFEAGQDWTIFGSSALMNLFETTFFGAYWGNVYERAPQMRLGFVQKLGGSRNWKLSPEFAIMTPAEGNLPADAVTRPAPQPSTRLPSRQSRLAPTPCSTALATSWDTASARALTMRSPRLNPESCCSSSSTRLRALFPLRFFGADSTRAPGNGAGLSSTACPTCPGGVDTLQSCLPKRRRQQQQRIRQSDRVSLPTRWATVVASGYMGADLRFFFGGETLSNYNQAAGLTNKANGLSVDGSSTVVFGTNARRQCRHCSTKGGARLRRIHPGWLPHLALVQC